MQFWRKYEAFVIACMADAAWNFRSCSAGMRHMAERVAPQFQRLGPVGDLGRHRLWHYLRGGWFAGIIAGYGEIA